MHMFITPMVNAILSKNLMYTDSFRLSLIKSRMRYFSINGSITEGEMNFVSFRHENMIKSHSRGVVNLLVVTSNELTPVSPNFSSPLSNQRFGLFH